MVIVLSNVYCTVLLANVLYCTVLLANVYYCTVLLTNVSYGTELASISNQIKFAIFLNTVLAFKVQSSKNTTSKLFDVAKERETRNYI